MYRVISQLLASEEDKFDTSKYRESDLQYLADLGLITIRPTIKISNRIYQEIIPRELTFSTQYSIANQEQSWYLTSGDTPNSSYLNMPKLLKAFQQYFRENSESWIDQFEYREAGPQLLIQAFLQRIINGGGRINREYGLGRGRTDLAIEWPINSEEGLYGEIQRIIIELKIHHKKQKLESIIEQGIEQSVAYADKLNAQETHLIIFNRDPEVSWDDKIWQKTEKGIMVWGC